MHQNETAEENSIVDQLDFTARSSKRVSWEAWEFVIPAPFQVEVTNASYGYLKDEHRYTVGIDERDGTLVPSECDCPSDLHREEDCKHKLAVATIAGPPVLEAARTATTGQNREEPRTATETVAEKLRADGGTISFEEPCACEDDPEPCVDCYIEGRRELPYPASSHSPIKST